MDKQQLSGFRYLVSLLGADYDIMKEAESNVQVKFYVSAVTIILIFVVSCLSIRYAVSLIFHALYVEVLLSLFLALLFVCMYIFLLHTFSKKPLGGGVVKKSLRRSLFNPSNLLRTTFVAFMGFVIAKPIEIYVFEPQLDDDVQQYKEQLLVGHRAKVEDLFAKDLAQIEKRKQRLQELGFFLMGTGTSQADSWNRRIDSLRVQKEVLLQAGQDEINRADFFTYRVKIVERKYKLSLFICLFTILLCLFPGYLIYSLSGNAHYYQRKNEMETAVVLGHYQAMVKAYTKLFASRYQAQVELYTVYEDPPFNTKRKKTPVYQPQSDFLKKFSH